MFVWLHDWLSLLDVGSKIGQVRHAGFLGLWFLFNGCRPHKGRGFRCSSNANKHLLREILQLYVLQCTNRESAG